MADFAYPSRIANATSVAASPRRHAWIVRITHWIFTLSALGLLVSGIAIILAHPRFYWGETGGAGAPSLFDLPLPTMLGGPSGWGRSLHFQSAWVAVFAGLVYVLWGGVSGHFAKHLIPSAKEFSWIAIRASVIEHLHARKPTGDYNVLQKAAYLFVIFVMLPLFIDTGFAMSPAITSVFPQFVTLFGGHQTARTLHFFLSIVLVLFVIAHVGMVILAGFRSRMRAMITGDEGRGRA
ncbi:MAG: cytochrome b/b6 domain-containing protein [Bryobacteraceae bacterium]